MEEYEYQAEFIEQNFARVEAVCTQAEDLMEIEDGRVTVKLTHEPGEAVPKTELVEGELEAADVYEVMLRHGNSDFIHAAKTARQHNLIKHAKAATHGLSTWAIAKMMMFARNYSGPEDQAAIEEIHAKTDASTYADGTVVWNNFETDTEIIDITVTRLSGIPDVNTIKNVQILQTDNFVIRNTGFIYVDDKLQSVSKRFEPLNDELLNQLFEIDPILPNRVRNILIGEFTDEAEVEQKLQGVLGAYEKPAVAARISEVLPMVRERGLAVKANRQLELLAGSSLPTSMELEELLRKLLDI